MQPAGDGAGRSVERRLIVDKDDEQQRSVESARVMVVQGGHGCG
jgi:hypothetical protein